MDKNKGEYLDDVELKKLIPFWIVIVFILVAAVVVEITQDAKLENKVPAQIREIQEYQYILEP